MHIWLRPGRRWSRVRGAAVGLVVLACGEGPAPVLDRAAAGALAPVPNRAARIAADPGPCLGPSPRSVVLRGVVRERAFFGPPGYGETPTADRRVTVPVLVVPTPLAACPDPPGLPARLRARRPAPPAPTAQVQLFRVPSAVDWRQADTVTVYGTLVPATRRWHYTPAVVEVDSIPALQPSPQPRYSGRRRLGGRLTFRYT